jgi:hypothetical protein
MNNYKSYRKLHLIELINSIECVLSTSLTEANNASKTYSPELISQLSFEIGHVSGSIKHVLELINSSK